MRAGELPRNPQAGCPRYVHVEVCPLGARSALLNGRKVLGGRDDVVPAILAAFKR